MTRFAELLRVLAAAHGVNVLRAACRTVCCGRDAAHENELRFRRGQRAQPRTQTLNWELRSLSPIKRGAW